MPMHTYSLWVEESYANFVWVGGILHLQGGLYAYFATIKK
jgi:hypothetical protein